MKKQTSFRASIVGTAIALIAVVALAASWPVQGVKSLRIDSDGNGTYRELTETSVLGDVTGPVSSTDGALAIYDGAGGKTLKKADISVESGTSLTNVHLLRGATSGPNQHTLLPYDTVQDFGNAGNPWDHIVGNTMRCIEIDDQISAGLGGGNGISVAAGGNGFQISGKLQVSNQITSLVTTGTAPFVVASTTNVANLNASTLNGATFASPGTIGGTTPGAATFTSVSTTTSVRQWKSAAFAEYTDGVAVGDEYVAMIANGVVIAHFPVLAGDIIPSVSVKFKADGGGPDQVGVYLRVRGLTDDSFAEVGGSGGTLFDGNGGTMVIGTHTLSSPYTVATDAEIEVVGYEGSASVSSTIYAVGITKSKRVQ